MILPRPLATTAPRNAGNPANSFSLDRSTTISAPEALTSTAIWLQDALRPATGLPLDRHPNGTIRLRLDGAFGDEEYRLLVTPEFIEVSGGTEAGVFYGCQSLLQLLPSAVFRRSLVRNVKWDIAETTVVDAPRFVWRGVMLDVARHFLPKHSLLRFIDLMAMHKLNVLHLHLTDDQGWRIEITRYPKLTEIGGWRRETQLGAPIDSPGDNRPHGGFYTQDDIREIVAYATSRFITVVPEIESPGHVQAAIASYPELGVSGEPLEVWTRWGINQNVLNAEQETVDFFANVLDEVMDLFPSQFIGVGGDECLKDQWRGDALVQQRIAERGLQDENALQAWFIAQLNERITSRGRRIFGWDEILDGDLPHDAVVASWRGMSGALFAAQRGHDVIACPDDTVYLDYRQSLLPDEPIPVAVPLTVQDVYKFQPIPPELTEDEAKHVLGGQANVWTEYMDSPRTIDYLVFPRLSAIAEVLWSGPDGDFAEFEPRLDCHLHRLDALGVEFRQKDGPLPWQRRPGVLGRPSAPAER